MLLISLIILWSIGLGLASGFLAGLLGVGGGLIIVPALLWLLPHYGYPINHSYHAALATSLASIIITSSLSAWAHQKRKGIVWAHIQALSLPIAIGAILGGWVATSVPDTFLRSLFVIFALFMGWRLQQATTSLDSASPPMPLKSVRPIGMGIGLISSWIGIGGGSLSVPLLLRQGLPMQQAVGTSALLGLIIALPASIGFICTSGNIPHLPAYSVGFIYLPALLGISLGSVLSTQIGAAWAHRLPRLVLKRIFSYLLYI